MSNSEDCGLRPFANGTEFEYWDEANCCQCARAPWGGDCGVREYDEDVVAKGGRCEIFDGLLNAQCTDEQITPELAKRMGWPANARNEKGQWLLGWPCGEFQAGQ